MDHGSRRAGRAWGRGCVGLDLPSVYVPSRVVPGHTIMRPGTTCRIHYHAGIATLHMVDTVRRNSTFRSFVSEPALDGRDFVAKKSISSVSLSPGHQQSYHGREVASALANDINQSKIGACNNGMKVESKYPLLELISWGRHEHERMRN